jgi:hypothetical protein
MRNRKSKLSTYPSFFAEDGQRQFKHYFAPFKIYWILPLSRKLRIFLNYFLGPLLFVVIGLSIYRQVQGQKDATQHWATIRASLEGTQRWRLFAVMALMLFNWGIESLKWKLLLKHILNISYFRAFKSVISGVAFTMITPNRTGEFIGRVFYVPDGSRIRAAALTLVGSASQMIITLSAGGTGLFVLRNYLSKHTDQLQGLSLYWLNGLLYGTGVCLCLALLFYFRISWLMKIIEKIPPFTKYAYHIKPLEEVESKELFTILFLSVLRFSVFIAQYWLLFTLFDVGLTTWQSVSTVSVLFLVLAIVPTIALAELGIRTKASLALFSIFSTNTIGILVATASVWLINIIFPAIAGSLFVLGIKLFRKD